MNMLTDPQLTDLQPDSAQAVIAAARDLATIWQGLPGGWRRLRPEAVALIEAVHAHERAATAVTCLSCGAPYGQPHRAGCEFTFAQAVTV